MVAVTMYVRQGCLQSQRARALLHRKGAHVEEVDITQDPARREEMIARSGGRTNTPQIFIDGQHVGGTDDLMDLDECGALDWRLEGGLAGEAHPS